jgi:hypothetical protein
MGNKSGVEAQNLANTLLKDFDYELITKKGD